MSQLTVTEQGVRTRSTNQGAALALASFGALLAFLDVTIVNVAFPSIQKSFPHSSYGALSWVLNSYNIVFAALLVAAGRFADLFGRRRVFVVGLVVFTVASAACAAAPGVKTLVALRCLQAVGAALIVPASLALVVHAFPGEHRAHAIGLWGATAAFASGVGPPLGGLLVQIDDWRLAFLVNVPLGIVAIAAAGRVLVESRAPGRRRLPDLPGVAFLGLATASLTLGIVQGPSWGWTDLRVLAADAATVALALAFVRSSRSHPVPVLDPALLRIRSFATANAVTFVAGMGFYAYLLNNILWLHYVWGYGLLRSGFAVAPGAVVAAVVAGVFGSVADRRGYRVVTTVGALIWSGAYVWYLTAVGTHPDFLATWLPGQVLSGIGVGMTLPILASAALAAVPGARYATAAAVVSSTRQLGAVVGIAVLVVLIGSPTRGSAATAFRHGWVLSLVCFAVAAAGCLRLRREPVSADDVESAAAPGAPMLRVHRVADATDATALSRSTVLSRLPEAKRARLLDDDSLVRLHAGRWLFRTGDPADAMYVVRSGRLEVVADGVLRELGEGDVVGELALLTGSPRSAGVRARRDSVLWRVTPERFDTVVQRDPAALRALAVSLAEQVQSPRSTDGRPTAPRVVSVVGIGDGAPVAAVADRLAAELRRHLRVHVTTSMTAEELHRAEPQNDRVLLVAEDPRRRFHGFAVRQADRIVVVADAASLPPTCLANAGPEGHVLLVGAAPARSTVVAWHDALTPRTVTPTDEAGLPAGVSAIARRIGGRSLGVVVAGGGARSLAAIGVLEELERAGYVVDRYAGCSVGSVVAGLAALGRDAASIDAICYDEFVRRNPFNDYRFPTVSIAAGHKTESAIQRQFGEMLFEELPSELVLVSTNLLDRSLVVHRRGAVGAAVRASLSLPGLYPPARVDDGVHVDGGVLDNLPVQPLADRDEGPVVAIDISAGSSSRTRSGPPPTPSLGETLLRTMLIGGSLNLEEARRRAAIVVTPDTRGIGLLEFHQLDRAREAGRAAGLAVVAALPEVLGGRAPDVPAQRSPGDLVIDLRDPVTTRAPRGPR